ncbi:homoserine dehydrogenase [Ligilactobacillus salivarius]|jgi:homoserine dehydrogenase|uniref:Homoserine dehydrogenase n=3 Tax=Ligilactobacillus salivarius TaxID=1624 RepID=A0A1V9R9B8_9LACO|nr:homoserine dehydrogenase [Ligilactobacillus salivarius]PEG97111.1 homoserine dehydrogenase [Lactobacillus sp. UMNPBX9]PEH10322.1 homoserine dehydrogenase [Lactobacillus sp. UMNPBX2]EGL98784.1 homoserine dehydrogenase [Ligilactobacillus salivarius NIAS840]EGM52044.1 Homoserine dehydrogenase [Ligilactobacillus salivarius GJ-24]MBM6955891.1 homoserine dehydrogenase [Ligilactobacillus salivarius]
METINIGILGLGTVGSGVVRILQSHADKISSITGRKLKVKTVVVRDMTKKRTVDLDGVTLTDDFEMLINDDSIQMVVEVMGTVEKAREYIKRLLEAGKHVVTANKDLIATYGPELTKLAKEKKCDLFYEASVAGGIPILRTIVNSFAADQIVSVKGIVNGTTNYILTQMNQNNVAYEEALKDAQKLGFAEADPTNDVEGIDAAYKMIILTQFAFGKDITLDDVKIEGISKIQLSDIKEAKRLGYNIKLLGVAEKVNDHITVSVGPVLVPQTHPLATVINENNAVFVTGVAVGETMFYGPGAGELPTANSVLSDIISVTKNIVMGITGNSFNDYSHEIKLATPDEVKNPYYISLIVPDKTGEMLKLTELFTNVEASFKLITQTEANEGFAKISIVTHAMTEAQLLKIEEGLKQAKDVELLAAYKVLEKG